MSLPQRLLPAVLAKKALHDAVILPGTVWQHLVLSLHSTDSAQNEFTVVSDPTLATFLAVANSSFRDLP